MEITEGGKTMALDKFTPYLFVSAGEQSNKFLTPAYADGIAKFQAQRAQELTGLTVRINLIQEGTGDPSESNIRPISGRTGLTVTEAGKNIAKPVATTATLAGVSWAVTDDGKVTANGTATGNTQVNFNLVNNVLQLPKNVPLTISGSTTELAVRVCYRTIDAPSTTVTLATSYDGADATGTIPDNAKDSWIRVINAAGTGVEINSECYPMVRLSGNADYEPYRGNTYSVTWETEAGTVYGGTLDVVSGVLTVDKYLLTLADTSTPTVGAYSYNQNPNRWQVSLSGDLMPSNDTMAQSICDKFAYWGGAFTGWPDGTFRFSGIQSDGSRFLQFKWDGQPTTGAELRALLAENPIHFVIPLATPTTYQLTPTEVRTIPGFNQVYSDAGPVIDIQF